MKWTRACSYALRAVAFLAAQKQSRPIASHDIAQACGAPVLFLLKVLGPLVSAGFLYSLKGPHGGYRLAHPASTISVLEIIEAVDGAVRGHAPVVQADGSDQLDRRLETICNQSAEAVRTELRKIYLSDL